MLGVYKENKDLELKNEILLKYFEVKGSTLKGYRRSVMLPFELYFTTRIVHNIKVLASYVASTIIILYVLVKFWLQSRKGTSKTQIG